MGISLFQLETEFFISRELKSDAFVAIKKLTSRYSNDGKQMAFVSLDEVKQAENLEEALITLRWVPEVDEDGNVNEIFFSGEKLGNDYEIFESIAEYIENGSFITILKEDGKSSRVRRWLFSDGKIVKQKGTIVFE